MIPMDLKILVVRRATAGAVQVVLAEKPYRILWLPRSQISPSNIVAGQRDILIHLTRFIAEKKQEEIDNPTPY